MSNGLPLEVLGLISPILCWVEEVQKPGLPISWQETDLSFEDRAKGWLMRELPTYSFDTFDEIIILGRDQRRPCQFPREPRRPKGQLRAMAPPEGFDLVAMFHRLSKRYFKWIGNELCIREGRIVELHELAIRFPVRHLIRYCHADAVVRGYISQDGAFELPVQLSQLNTTSQGLRTVVEQGLSEGHLHLNGIINADECWCDHLLRQLSPRIKDSLTPAARKLLLQGRSAVRLLALGVLYTALNKENPKLPFRLISHLDKMYRASGVMDHQAAYMEFKKEFFADLHEVHSNLSRDTTSRNNPELKWLFPLLLSDADCILLNGHRASMKQGTNHLNGMRKRIDLLEQLHLAVHKILIKNNIRSGSRSHQQERGESPPNVLPHQQNGPSPLREFLHQVFCRYIIYHTHHWQKATQSGKTTGLRNFKRFFDSRQREPFIEERAEMQGLAIERLSQSTPLRAVEGRLSPPSAGVSRYKPWILAFAKQVKENRLDKFGIVIHFRKKNHEIQGQRKKPKQRLELRDGKIRRLTQADAFRLFRLLSTPHIVVPFIVGIDAANLELTTPPEVFAPTFRFLRDFPIKFRPDLIAHRQFADKQHIEALVGNRRLGMTYHVGEDFRHLLSGLRAIHEVIEFLKPLPGDRLGHAIALALNPEVWAAQAGYQAVLPMQEWLDTLVWLHTILGPGHELIGQLEVEDLIQFYTRQIYGKTLLDTHQEGKVEHEWMPATLYDSWKLRQLDPYSLDRKHLLDDKFHIRMQGRGLEHRRWFDVQSRVLNEVDQHIGTNAAYHLVKLYWYGPRVRQIGGRIITIDMQNRKHLWLKVFHEVQQRMQEMVRDRQLVIEVNPSSNRIIGPMSKIADHPIFQLTLDKEQHLARQIRTTINTDNPGIFATSLAHEFYLLGESLMGRGVPEPETVRWLNWLRENGINCSFLHVLPDADNKHMATILERLLKTHNPTLRRLQGKRRKYKPFEQRVKEKWKRHDNNGNSNSIDIKRYNLLKGELETLRRKLDQYIPKNA